MDLREAAEKKMGQDRIDLDEATGRTVLGSTRVPMKPKAEMKGS